MKSFKERVLSDITEDLSMNNEQLQQSIIFESFKELQHKPGNVFHGQVIVKEYLDEHKGYIAFVYNAKYSKLGGYRFDCSMLNVEMVKAVSTLV